MAAVGVLSRKGAHASTLQDVAEAAGVSKGALTYHFKSRDELLDEVLVRCAQRLRGRLSEALGTHPSEPPARRAREVLAAAVRALDPTDPEVAALSDLAALSRHDARLRGHVSLCLAELEQALLDAVVTPRLAAGLAPRVPAGAIARLCLGALLGAGLLEPPAEADAQAHTLALEKALAGLFEA